MPETTIVPPSEDDVRLARQIVAAYRASGIGAKTYRGQPFVEREEGWEGPLEVHELQTAHRDEIDGVEQRVREAIRECYGRWGHLIRTDFDRETWAICILSPVHLVRMGLSEQQARMYVNVAHSLRQRGDLWR